MNDLERQLTLALQPQPAPEGFADRVCAAARQRRSRRRNWLMAASFLTLLLPGGYAYRVHHQRQHAEQQLRLALELASEKLNSAFQRLNASPE